MILEFKIALSAILLGWICHVLAEISYDGSSNYSHEIRSHHWFTFFSFILWGIGVIAVIIGVWKS
jgi:hypothetical protein